MGHVSLPFSGNVSQSINPWTWVFSPSGSQTGLFNFNIDLGPSSDPSVELEILASVASYGKQIGRMQDVVAILLERLPKDSITAEEQDAIDDFSALSHEISKVKKKKRRQAV